MMSYYINLTVAVCFSLLSYRIHWWLPAVIFPAWIFLSRVRPIPSSQITLYRIWGMRIYFYLVATLYMIGQAILFQIYIGSWYGWLLGLILGWTVGGMTAGKLEPKLMHRSLP